MQTSCKDHGNRVKHGVEPTWSLGVNSRAHFSGVHVVQAAASLLLVEGAAAREDKGGRFTACVSAVKFRR